MMPRKKIVGMAQPQRPAAATSNPIMIGTPSNDFLAMSCRSRGTPKSSASRSIVCATGVLSVTAPSGFVDFAGGSPLVTADAEGVNAFSQVGQCTVLPATSAGRSSVLEQCGHAMVAMVVMSHVVELQT